MAASRAGTGDNAQQQQSDSPDSKSGLPMKERYDQSPDLRHESYDYTPSDSDSRKGDRSTLECGSDDDSATDRTRPQNYLPQEGPDPPTNSLRTESRGSLTLHGRGAPPSYEDSVAAYRRSNNDNNNYAPSSRAEKQEPAAAFSIPSFRLPGDCSPLSPKSAAPESPVSSSVSPVSPVSPMMLVAAQPPPLISTAQEHHQQHQSQQAYSSGRPILAPSLAALSVPLARTTTSSSLSSSLQQYSSNLCSTTAMDKECAKARKILQSFLASHANQSCPSLGGVQDTKPATNRSSSKSTPVQIPDTVLQQAHGLVIYTVIRAGFNLSGSMGSGVVLARLPSPDNSVGGDTSSISTSSSGFRRWSGPSAFSVYGAGASLIGGFDVSESVCVLNSAEAVSAFYHGTTSRGGAELGSYQRNVVRFGGKSGGGGGGGALAVAPGPTVHSGSPTKGEATPPMWIYNKTRGLYIGGSVDGTVFNEKRDVNESFYDEPGITPDCILTGRVRPEFQGAAGAVLGGIVALGFGKWGEG
ncbi:hypothetical protein PG991_012306 [Apiospora marii]|uniref:Ysc84 actin-binding domain-containing protein n=1 Tax=Apiospora marii TaxID=335849 RepID=A0ABR1RAD3_9PEZI